MTDRSETDAGARLEAWLSRAPQPRASSAFCDSVMQAIGTRGGRARLWRVRVRELFFAPHLLRWNLAGATMTMALVLMVGFAVVERVDRRNLPAAMVAMKSSGKHMVTVRFDLTDPRAREVSLAGDFTQWQPRVPLKRHAGGVWSAKVQLPPGDYEYVFMVNGEHWVSDPRADWYRNDGFGNRNAVVTVPSA